MSTHAVRVERIRSVSPHPNADRLDLVQVLDWCCVASKGAFKEGDLAVYIPIDSLLPPALEAFIFGPDSKVKLSKGRIKTIKLRGAISQGLVCSVPEIALYLRSGLNYGDDVTKALGVTKYEPPAAPFQGSSASAQGTRKQPNPNFHRYTGIENAKNYPNVFEHDERVVVTEKIHGTNFRCGWVPFQATTLWKRLLRFLRIAPSHEFVYGSHNIQLQDKMLAKTFYDKNVYAEAVIRHDLKEQTSNLLHAFHADAVVIYGEIYGDGIQKGYTYGCKPGERRLVLFDLMVDGKYQGLSVLRGVCNALRVPDVPVLYEGPFTAEKIAMLKSGDSVLASTQKVREGVVVRALHESQHPLLGRKILKFVSDEYLLKDQTDFH